MEARSLVVHTASHPAPATEGPPDLRCFGEQAGCMLHDFARSEGEFGPPEQQVGPSHSSGCTPDPCPTRGDV
eukprot:2575151-Alexandrium_andersonii.AAC.1